MARTAILVLALLMTSVGCAHRVNINSNPPGAKVYVDGTLIGVSPASFVEKSATGRSYQIKIEKEGYQTLETVEKQRFNTTYGVISIVAGILTFGLGFIGLLWSFTLEDYYIYTLQRA